MNRRPATQVHDLQLWLVAGWSGAERKTRGELLLLECCSRDKSGPPELRTVGGAAFCCAEEEGWLVLIWWRWVVRRFGGIFPIRELLVKRGARVVKVQRRPPAADTSTTTCGHWAAVVKGNSCVSCSCLYVQRNTACCVPVCVWAEERCPRKKGKRKAACGLVAAARREGVVVSFRGRSVC